jgi:hypothetical protein
MRCRGSCGKGFFERKKSGQIKQWESGMWGGDGDDSLESNAVCALMCPVGGPQRIIGRENQRKQIQESWKDSGNLQSSKKKKKKRNAQLIY